jgi:hypothetical protein
MAADGVRREAHGGLELRLERSVRDRVKDYRPENDARNWLKTFFFACRSAGFQIPELVNDLLRRMTFEVFRDPGARQEPQRRTRRGDPGPAGDPPGGGMVDIPDDGELEWSALVRRQILSADLGEVADHQEMMTYAARFLRARCRPLPTEVLAFRHMIQEMEVAPGENLLDLVNRVQSNWEESQVLADPPAVAERDLAETVVSAVGRVPEIGLELAVQLAGLGVSTKRPRISELTVALRNLSHRDGPRLGAPVAVQRVTPETPRVEDEASLTGMVRAIAKELSHLAGRVDALGTPERGGGRDFSPVVDAIQRRHAQ